MKKRAGYAGLILSLCIGVVFLWVGITKVFLSGSPEATIATILGTLNIPLSAAAVGIAIGAAQILIGIMLIIGLYVEFAGTAGVLLILAGIISTAMILPAGIGYAVVKDIGILGGTAFLAIAGRR